MHFDSAIRSLLLAIVLNFAVCLPGQSCSQDVQDRLKDWPAGVRARGDLSQSRSYVYDFANISVKTLQARLGRIGVEVPVELDGQLSGWIWVQRSAASWFDLANYKVEGAVRSPDLTIDSWLVKEANLRFGYEGGNWYIGKLAGELRSATGTSAVGVVDANARLLLASSSIVEVVATVGSIDLQALLQSFGLEIELKNSRGALSVAAAFPIANALDLTTWRADLKLALDDIATPWIESEGRATASVELREGKWKLTDGQVKVAEQNLNIAGSGDLNDDLPLELSLSGDEIDVSQLLQQLKNPELANQLTGSIQLNANLNANRTSGIKNATATIESSALKVRSLAIENLTVSADYTQERIWLDFAGAEVAAGSVKGFATWPDMDSMVLDLPSQAQLELKSIQLEELAPLKLPIEIGGRVSGSLEFDVVKRDGVGNWKTVGDIEIDGLQAAGTNFGNAKLDLKKELSANELVGNVTLQQGNGGLESEIVLTLTTAPDAKIHSTRLARYQAAGRLDNYDLVSRIGEAGETIPLQAFGSFNVSGSPDRWLEQGSVSFADSTAKIGDRLIQLEMADVSFNESEYRVERFRLLSSDSRIVGAASFRRDAIGDHLLRLRIVDAPLKASLERLVPKPFASIDGLVNMEMELRKAAANQDLRDDWTGQARGSLNSVSFRGKPIGDLAFRADIRDELMTAQIDGKVIGGAANATLTLPRSVLEESSIPGKTPATFSASLANIQARRLAEFLFAGNIAKDIVGTLSVELTAEGTSLSNPVVTAKVKIPALKSKNKSLVRNFSSELRYSEDQVFIERLSGGFANGRIEAQGFLKLDKADNLASLADARINFSAKRLDANYLVSLVSPKYAEYFAGAIDYRGTATYRRGFQLNGSASIKKGNLFGFPIQVVRGGLRTEFTPEGQFSQAISRDLHGTGIGGRYQGKIDIHQETNLTLETSGRISQGKLAQLGRALDFENTIGSGTFNGNFNFDSDQIESVRALRGGLQIKFEGGDVNSIPLLSSIDRFVPLAQFTSTDIENGRLDARISQGQLRIADLIVSSKAFLLAANGNMTLDGSKLDLDMVVQTGGTVQQQLTQTAFERLLLSPIPQVALVNELNELIRNRSVFLHVSGRSSRPVIQAKPAQTAAKAFLQSFSRQLIGVAPTDNQ